MLVTLTADCQAMCESADWRPRFRLIYSSVESFTFGNQIAILGMNPAGGPADVSDAELERPLSEPGYTAYLDDAWRPHSRGQAPLQRALQTIAMVLAGADPSEALAAIRKTDQKPEGRIGPAATALLRNASSGNIIPFRGDLRKMPPEFRNEGERIGWRLLSLARPRPRFIITLANGVKDVPWSTILAQSRQSRKTDHEEWTSRIMRRKYRDVRLMDGQLKGAVLVGLPAVVRDQRLTFREELVSPMLDVLARRWTAIGVTNPGDYGGRKT